MVKRCGEEARALGPGPGHLTNIPRANSTQTTQAPTTCSRRTHDEPHGQSRRERVIREERDLWLESNWTHERERVRTCYCTESRIDVSSVRRVRATSCVALPRRRVCGKCARGAVPPALASHLGC